MLNSLKSYKNWCGRV